MRKEYRDNMQLLLTMYNIALVGSVIIVVLNAAERFQATTRVFITVCILWVTVFSSCVFVVPKLLQIRSRKFNPVEEDVLARRAWSIVGNVSNSIPRIGRRVSYRNSQNSNSFGEQSEEDDDIIGSSGKKIRASFIKQATKQPMDAIQETRNSPDDDALSDISRAGEHLSKGKDSSEFLTTDKLSTSGSMSKSSSSSI